MTSTYRLSSRVCLAGLFAATLAACGGGGGGGDGGSAPPPPAPAPNSGTRVTNCTVAFVPGSLLADAPGTGPLVGFLPGSLLAAAPVDPSLQRSGISPLLGLSGYHPQRVLVGLNASQAAQLGKQSVGGDADLSALGLRQLSQINLATQSLVKTSAGGADAAAASAVAVYEISEPGLSVPQAIERLQQSGKVAYAEPDYQMRKSATPSDTYYGEMWHMKNTGQNGGVAGNDIGAETAWNLSTGSGNMVVAVMDDGLLTGHPDFAGNLWTNPKEIPGNGIDDDANGIVDDVNGADVVLNSGNVQPYNRQDSDHGTMVSGFVAARGNNSLGVVGVNWSAKLMTVKIEGPGPDYSLFTSDFVKGINYVVKQKAAGVNVRVLNISYGVSAASQSLRDALASAGNAGVLVVAASGNEGTNVPSYPGSYDLPNIINVGATNRFNEFAEFSNYGPTVDLYAPGQNVVTTSSRASVTDGSLVAPNYRRINGTSFSSPIVAGAAALLWDREPGQTLAQVRARLILTAAPYVDSAQAGAGKLNLPAAMNAKASCS
jgi:subtilisin family serine protease